MRFVEIEDDSKQMAFDTLLKGTHPKGCVHSIGDPRMEECLMFLHFTWYTMSCAPNMCTRSCAIKMSKVAFKSAGGEVPSPFK